MAEHLCRDRGLPYEREMSHAVFTSLKLKYQRSINKYGSHDSDAI